MTMEIQKEINLYENPYEDIDKDNPVFDFHNQAIVYGVLIELTQGIVKSYKSDLYYDALWVQEHIPKKWKRGDSFVFWYACRQTGTSVGQDPDCIVPYNEYAWEVQLKADYGTRWDGTTRDWGADLQITTKPCKIASRSAADDYDFGFDPSAIERLLDVADCEEEENGDQR